MIIRRKEDPAIFGRRSKAWPCLALTLLLLALYWQARRQAVDIHLFQGPSSYEIGDQKQKNFQETTNSDATRPSSSVAPWLKAWPDATQKPTLHGGILLFFHVPKTGGTTIRENFCNATRFPQVLYRTAFIKKEFETIARQIDAWFQGGAIRQTTHNQNNEKQVQTLMVELHGRNTPTLPSLVPYLEKWKQQSEQTNTPFKVMTMLRDPVAFALSFFHFFHVFGDKRFQHLESNVPNLRASLQWNPQCLYLVRGEQPYFRPRKFYNATQDDCHHMKALLQSHFDWIGDTQHLSRETLPLLSYWITGTTVPNLPWAKANAASSQMDDRALLLFNDLDETTRQLIQSKSIYDQQLYDHVLTPRPKQEDGD